MGNRAFVKSQIRVLSQNKYQRHLERIENSREAVCIVDETGRFENVNGKFRSLLNFSQQTDLSNETIFNFFPKQQPDSQKTSLKFLYDQLEQLSNSTTGWHKFNWYYKARNELLIPTRTIITMFQVSNTTLFQLVSKCIRKKKQVKRAKRKIKQRRLTKREKKKQFSFMNVSQRPIQRSLTYSGLLIEERKKKHRLKNVRRTRTAQARLDKPISFERVRPIHHRFRTPNLIPENFSYIDFSKKKFKKEKKSQSNLNENENNITEKNETTELSNNFNLNKKKNNSLIGQKQPQDEKGYLQKLLQFNNNDDFNESIGSNLNQGEEKKLYLQSEKYISKKATNSKFFQMFSNLAQEEKTDMIYSHIDLIKELVRNLNDHYLEYQVTNSLNDVFDLVIKTENYFDKKIKSSHFKYQELEKKKSQVTNKK
ncbi:hypothetical protein M0813_18201 [Anaeramoeba flamelloides]|uniref:PAS domain-containing protein n=1 Tax=Anaeramoeba flamelloides TaxID=1746091 RepID=A0ABQ8YTQ1_9EUKA|nr:hypothetical protein M0813_18201 [Anaeramoeba flamelloides]